MRRAARMAEHVASSAAASAGSAEESLDMYGNAWRCAGSGALEVQNADARWRDAPAGWQAVPPPPNVAPGGCSMLAADGDGFVWCSDGAALWRMDGRKGAVNTPPQGTRSAAPNGQSTAPFEDGFGVWIPFPRAELPAAGAAIVSLGRAIYSGWAEVTMDDGSAVEVNVAPTAVAEDGDGASGGFGGAVVRPAATSPPAWTADWTEVSRLPGGGNHDVFCAVLDGIVYVAGGLTDWWGFPADVHVFDELWAYDLAADSWSVASRIPYPTCYCGLTALDGRIWVVGGADDRAPGHRRLPSSSGGDVEEEQEEYERGINTVVGFSPADGSWCEGAPLCPEAVAVHPGYGPFSLALNGRLYAITMAHASMWSWAPGETETDGWRPEPSPPKAMNQMSGAVLDGVGYIICQDGCFSFDPRSGVWSELPSVPGGDLTAPHVAAHNGYIWAAMDHTSNRTARFSPETQQWTLGPDAPTANGWGGAASIGGQLLIVSGAHSDDLQGRVIFDDRCFLLRE